jgi:hypothetical protein
MFWNVSRAICSGLKKEKSDAIRNSSQRTATAANASFADRGSSFDRELKDRQTRVEVLYKGSGRSATLICFYWA